MTLDAKRDARKAAEIIRQSAHEANPEAGAALAVVGLPHGVEGRTASGFLPFRSEIDTRPLLARLREDGWITALPVIVARGEPLIFRQWRAGDVLVKGGFGIDIPPVTAPEVVPDVLIVPLLAFDRAGYRLGYGGGYYDRTIEKLRALKAIAAIGAAYGAQEVAAVPHGPHDQRLDWILTEKGAIPCG